jgi:hypothetical protein
MKGALSTMGETQSPPQAQADFKEADPSSPAYIKNKPEMAQNSRIDKIFLTGGGSHG